MTSGTVFDRRKYWKALWRKYNYPFALNLVPTIVDNEKSGNIGSIILDLGCSCNPVTNWLDLSHRKRMLLDISSLVHDLSSLSDAPVTVECDLCTFDKNATDYRVFKEALKKMNTDKLDTIIAADNLLNYIPWKSVFKSLDDDLKKNGSLYLCFGINVGRGEAFHIQRPDSCQEVIRFFTIDLGYKIIESCGQSTCFALVLEKTACRKGG